MTAHTARAHAQLAPSAAHRWLHCPGSVAATAGLAEKSSTYAAEGTAAHELAAWCLTQGEMAYDRLGLVIDIRHDPDLFPDEAEPDGVRFFPVDDEMAEAVQTYLDTIQQLDAGKHSTLEVEQRLDMRHLHPEIFGTGDAVVFEERARHLHVVDFKYGKGVAVDVAENPQLLLYGAGAARRYADKRIDKVTLWIVQPRAPHADGPVRSWTTTALDLLEFEDDIRKAATATEDPDAPRVAGDWCRFCRALPLCPAARDRARASAASEFVDDADKPDPAKLGANALAAILREAEFVGNWVKAVQEYAHSEATAGRPPAGYKLVAKRATRKWRDDDAIVIDQLTALGLETPEILTEPELKSPAQVEKLLGKKRFAAVEEDLVVKQSTGTNLVPVEDPRPAVKADAAGEFVD